VVDLGGTGLLADDTLAMPALRRPDINLSALIDIAFILVIFIVLAANFDRYDHISVDLPAVNAAATVVQQRDRFDVALSADGIVSSAGESVPSRFDLLKEQSQLGEYLTAQAALQQGPEAQQGSSEKQAAASIFADRAVRAEQLLRLMSLLRASGFRSIQLVTRRDGAVKYNVNG